MVCITNLRKKARAVNGQIYDISQSIKSATQILKLAIAENESSLNEVQLSNLRIALSLFENVDRKTGVLGKTASEMFSYQCKLINTLNNYMDEASKTTHSKEAAK